MRSALLVLAATACRPDPRDTAPATSSPTGTASCFTAALDAGALPLDPIVRVRRDTPGPAWVVCTAQDDPEDRLLAESTEDRTDHALHVYGVAADRAYTCEVHAGCGEPVALALRTDPVADHDGWTVTTGAGAMDGVYTLFNDQPSCTGGLQRLFVVDPDGRARWVYPVGSEFVVDIDAAYIGDGVVHLGGGWGLFDANQPNRGVVRQVDLSGNVLLERTEPAFGLGFNHHSQVLPSGEILSLTTSVESDGQGASWYGVAVEQWDPATAQVTWSWDSQRLFDAGEEPLPTQISPYHANSVTLRDDPWGPAAWISTYYGRAIWRVDRNTGARTHVFGPGGDMAVVDPSGAPLPDAELPWGQHDPDYTDDGRVLLYDNGVDRPGGSYSRVAEYRLDLDARTATLLWTWTEPGWFDPIVGDADYLPGGHVLVAQGHHWCLSFNGDTSSVVEVDPATGEVVWRLDHDTPANALYRAQRYDGCAMFANAKYCPAVAARIAELEATSW